MARLGIKMKGSTMPRDGSTMMTTDDRGRVSPMSAEIQRIADAVRAFNKPASLKLAESNLSQARARRAQFDAEHRGACAAFHNGAPGVGVTALRAAINETEKQQREAEAVVEAERKALDEARQKAAPKFQAMAEPAAAAAGRVLREMLAHVDTVADALTEIASLADTNGWPAPKQASPDILHAVRNLRAVLNARGI